ncbi:MAG TPA: arginine deiminase family protein [Vicinamibacterales bacterium]|nr:arginine deiminase family protein [Vicinamibacterales bacterium]
MISEHERLASVLVKHAREAFIDDATIQSQWKRLNFSAPPDLPRALDEYDRFIEAIATSGCEILWLGADGHTTLDSIYTRDAAIVSERGIILCNMGKASRCGEPDAEERELRARGWPIAGSIRAPGHLEGGDLIWLDDRTLAVGLGKRTNPEGIRQLEALLDGTFDDLLVVRLPDYPGQHDVMHLMSLISPVDRDLAVVYSRLLPESFRATLQQRGYRFVEIPDDEFETMGCNVLALGPRECVMLNGNPKTRASLERAGANVRVYDGYEISLKGGGGPTCLTRPLARV